MVGGATVSVVGAVVSVVGEAAVDGAVVSVVGEQWLMELWFQWWEKQ